MSAQTTAVAVPGRAPVVDPLREVLDDLYSVELLFKERMNEYLSPIATLRKLWEDDKFAFLELLEKWPTSMRVLRSCAPEVVAEAERKAQEVKLVAAHIEALFAAESHRKAIDYEGVLSSAAELYARAWLVGLFVWRAYDRAQGFDYVPSALGVSIKETLGPERTSWIRRNKLIPFPEKFTRECIELGTRAYANRDLMRSGRTEDEERAVKTLNALGTFWTTACDLQDEQLEPVILRTIATTVKALLARALPEPSLVEAELTLTLIRPEFVPRSRRGAW